LLCWLFPFNRKLSSFAHGVGKYEDSSSLMWGTNFSRAEYSPRRFVTKAFQIRNDLSESKANVSLHVLEEAQFGSYHLNALCNKGPKMSWVFCSGSLTGAGEWLTRVTSREDVHAVTKLCPWEGFKIRPYRYWVHESRFHFCNQVRNGEGFDLTKSD
jgi:hypothetical protein